MVAQATVLWTEPRSDRPDVLSALEEAGCRVRLGNDYSQRTAQLSPDELIAAVRDVDGLMVGRREHVSRKMLEAAPRLVVVSKTGIGVDRIDVDAATSLGILVTNTPIPEHRDAVAEHTLGLLLGLGKRLREGDSAVRSGSWGRASNLLLSGKTAGVIGYGRIGRRVARLLAALDMRVLSFDPYAEVDEHAQAVSLETLLSEADVITLHALPTPETRHLLDAERLALVKPTAVVVNTSRGELIDEAALAEALRRGHLGGAALDVFEVEPPPVEGPIFSEDLVDRVLLTPHAGGGVSEARERMLSVMVDAHVAALRGIPPDVGIANPEVMPRWRARDAAPLQGDETDEEGRS